jgi:IS1 family transposase
MNKLSVARRAQIVASLVEGNSIRATCRMTGAAKATVMKLVVDLGAASTRYQDETLRELPCKRIQCDEIWTFVGAKKANLRPEERDVFGRGDVWTWTAICAETKLVPSWLVGPRDGSTAFRFMYDLRERLRERVQITTDGFHAYLLATAHAFEDGTADYAMLEKLYGSVPGPEGRYSPPVCVGAKKKPIFGQPDSRHISTSYAERANLTMRMSMRRFTRLTNAFSKKVENHRAAIALHFMWYNFGRVHQTLGETPAMAAGVETRRWTTEDVARLLEPGLEARGAA